MKIELMVKNGYLMPVKPESLKTLKDGLYIVDLKNNDTRTNQQNKAMHKYLDLVAYELNKGNHSIALTLKPHIMWEMLTVKELLFRPVMKALTGKESSTKLTKEEINNVYMTFSIALNEKFGIDIPFPSSEDI